MKLVDVHIHFEDILKYDNEDKIVSRALDSGIVRMLTVGSDRDRFDICLEFSRRYSCIKSCLALYPSHAYDSTDVEEAFEFIRLVKDKIIAIGECGLDYYITDNEKERRLQRELFARHIDLAKELDLPIIVHCRNSSSAVLDVLEENDASRVVLHYFEGNEEEIKRAVSLGYYLTVSTDVNDYDKISLKSKLVPLNLLLTETDSPVFPPKDIEYNEPSLIKIAIKHISEMKGISEQEVADKIYENYCEVFKDEGCN